MVEVVATVGVAGHLAIGSTLIVAGTLLAGVFGTLALVRHSSTSLFWFGVALWGAYALLLRFPT